MARNYWKLGVAKSRTHESDESSLREYLVNSISLMLSGIVPLNSFKVKLKSLPVQGSVTWVECDSEEDDHCTNLHFKSANSGGT